MKEVRNNAVIKGVYEMTGIEHKGYLTSYIILKSTTTEEELAWRCSFYGDNVFSLGKKVSVDPLHFMYIEEEFEDIPCIDLIAEVAKRSRHL